MVSPGEVFKRAEDIARADRVKITAVNTDRGSQFYASGGEKKKKGVSRFEPYRNARGVKHISSKRNNIRTIHVNFKEKHKYTIIDKKVEKKNDRRDATWMPRNLFPVWYGWGFLEFYAFNKLLGLIGIREKEKEYYQGIS